MTMYVIVWRYAVKPERGSEFERHYGSEGTWAEFFRRAPGFVRTELLRGDREYLTLDYWKSEEHFQRFERDNQDEYQALDRQFERLTEREERIGGFTSP